MKIFGKKEVTDTTIALELNGMTYTEFVSQELDAEMNRLRKEEKELTNGVNEILAGIKEQGGSEELTSMVVKLRQKLEVNVKESRQASVTYAVDPNLKVMALNLDRADGTNKGMDLFYVIGSKVNEILAMLPEIEKCYGSEYYSPLLFTQIKEGMYGLAGQFNNELSKLHKVDKKELEQKIHDRMEILRVRKEKSQTITNKLKNL